MSAITHHDCHRCGATASLRCSGCDSDAIYCGRACQKWDWRKKGGHKTLCQGPSASQKIHCILRKLFSAEWTWLNGLSVVQKVLFFRVHETQGDIRLNHYFLAGEVALVLARANAAALLTNVKRNTIPYGTKYYAKVIAPWYEEHKDFLNEQGFVVEFVEHRVHLSEDVLSCECVDVESNFCGKLAAPTGMAALVKDTRNPNINLVNEIFTVERSDDVSAWNEQDLLVDSTWNNMMKCISFKPAREQYNDDESSTIVTYNFTYPHQVFGGSTADDDVCCSPCLDFQFRVHVSDSESVGSHFLRCREAMAKIGLPITFVAFDQSEWANDDIARLWLAAAGGNSRTFNLWIDQGNIIGDMGLEEDRDSSIKAALATVMTFIEYRPS